MSTVFGLFPSNQDVSEELKKIGEAGFSQDSIRVLTKERPIKKLLGCEPNRIVAKYASWGALLGISTYGILVLVAVWCDCNLYLISQLIAFEIVLIGILIGALIGGIIGGFTGMAEYKKDTHLYTQGINIGDKVFVLQTERGDVEKAIKILNQIGCLGVRMLPQSNESV
ncbi:MAG: hypothetical protein WBF08_10900 [Candidatus Bathyarchaeia archaeon]